MQSTNASRLPAARLATHDGARRRARLRHWAVALATPAFLLAQPTIAVSSPAPTIVGFTASASAVSFDGGRVVLAGSAVNATTCTVAVKPAIKSVATTATCTGFTSQVDIPANSKPAPITYVFTLTAKGAGGSKTASAQVIQPGYPAPSIAAFTSSATSSAHTGGQVNLSGAVSNASACTLAAKPSVKGLVTNVGCSSFSTVALLPANTKAQPVTYVFTLTAKGLGGTRTSTVSIGVAAYPAPQISALRASPIALPLTGGKSTVSLDVAFAKTCATSISPAVSGFPKSIPCANGTASISLPPNAAVADARYTVNVTATGIGGTTKGSAEVFVLGSASTNTPRISAGFGHTCALRDNGTVACWGLNDSGQLGDGSTYLSSVPVDVTGLSGVTAVSAGGSFTCALLLGGSIKCWGYNGASDLGNGSQADSAVPVPVAGITNALAISAGFDHACALLVTGEVRCWGYNANGQLGNGTTDESSIPSAVAGLADASAISAGETHTCAVVKAGAVKCWGSNSDGQLGTSPSEGSLTPVLVPGVAGAIAVATGSLHSCALLASGSITCWGSNYSGQTGTGPEDGSIAPASVTGISSAIAISARSDQTCALLLSGAAACWGDNGWGELGNGTRDSSGSPTEVTPLSGVSSLSTGYYHTCAAVSAGIKCWGSNEWGQIGDGTRERSAGIKDATSVSVQNNFSCALLKSETVACWGIGTRGELGKGATGLSVESVDAIPVVGLSGATSITTGYAHACAVVRDGTVECWGANEDGQLGRGNTDADHPLAEPVLDIDSAVAVAAGGWHTCALLKTGKVACWGDNYLAQLGFFPPYYWQAPHGDAMYKVSTPRIVQGISDAVAITAGWSHTCALLATGSIRCWGANSYGQIGNDSTYLAPYPATVVGISDAVAIDAAWNQTCALRSSGEIWCWGSNDSSQLGDGTTTDSQVPVLVKGVSGAASMSIGRTMGCAISSGDVSCWGTPWIAQELRPAGLNLKGASLISLNLNHACAVMPSGALKCWGWAMSGWDYDSPIGLNVGYLERVTRPTAVVWRP